MSLSELFFGSGRDSDDGTADKYNVEMTFTLSHDVDDNRVHWLAGDMDRRPGESLDSVCSRALAEYIDKYVSCRTRLVQILSQRCWR